MTRRESLLAEIAHEVRSIRDRAIVRVAIDGVDGAGKTRFADELAEHFDEPVIRASVDSFHNPKSVRYAKGRSSPVGFYEDSFNYEQLRRLLLDPLSASPPEAYRCVFYDHSEDMEVAQDWQEPPATGILIFDGIFAHRPELRSYWDYSILLEVSPEESVRRCIAREGITGVPHDPDDPANARYVRGQAIYFENCHPASFCTRRISNERIESPLVVL